LYASSTSSSNSSFWFWTKRNSEMRAGVCVVSSKSPSSAGGGASVRTVRYTALRCVTVRNGVLQCSRGWREAAQVRTSDHPL
jgi:hypothetical protein